MEHLHARNLLGTNLLDLGNGTICHSASSCYCENWLVSRGSDLEKRTAQYLQWVTFGISVATLLWYAFQGWRATCGWEEVYVCIIETTKSVMEVFHEFDTPAMLYLSTGTPVVWLRYGEWLLTCPVLLIHLSNLTGLNNDYSLRTMGLLVSDVGCIVWGATAAMSTGYVRLTFFLIGCVYGGYTFFHAAKVYIEAYHIVPHGQCRKLVIMMAWVYFISWTLFPVLFAVGPEGFGHISLYGSSIGHCILDLFSKNIWGVMGNQLRVKIFQHIQLHGDIRKKQTIMVAGQELEIETMVEGDDDAGGGGAGSGKGGPGATSFLVVKVRPSRASTDLSSVGQLELPKQSGDRRSTEMSMRLPRVSFGGAAAASGRGGGSIDLSKMVRRMSLGASSAKTPSADTTPVTKVASRVSFSAAAANSAAAAANAAAAAADSIEPGRVMLVVPDSTMVEVFEELFDQLPVHFEVDPALSADDAVQLVQQASSRGAVYDFVLMHPEFLRDRGTMGLLPRLRSLSQRTAAFGWASKGPMKALIEDAPLDGWLEGPSFGRVIKQAALLELVRQMQKAKQQAVAAPGAQTGGVRGNTGDGGGLLLPRAGSGGNQVHPIIGGGLVPVSNTNDGSLTEYGATGGGNSLRRPGTGTGTGTGSSRTTGQGVVLTSTGSPPVSNTWMMAASSTGNGSMRATGGGGSAVGAASGRTASRQLMGPTGSGVFNGVGSGLGNVGSAYVQPQTFGGGDDVDDLDVDALTSLSAPNVQPAMASPRPVSRLSNNPLFVTPASPRNSMSRVGSLVPRPMSPLQPPTPAAAAAPIVASGAAAAAPAQLT